MARDNISPEERLFKVIQEGKASPPDAGGFGRKGMMAGWLGRIKGFFSFGRPKPLVIEIEARPAARQAAGVSPIRLRELDPRAINAILAVIWVMLTAAVIYYAANTKPNIAKITDTVSRIQLAMMKKRVIEALKPADFYLEEVKKKDLFHTKPKAVVTAEPKEAAKEGLQKLTEGLKLQGIAWGANPRAMIQDEKEAKMHFLNEGQMIGSNGLFVKKISRDKVIIGYKEAEMELL